MLLATVIIIIRHLKRRNRAAFRVKNLLSSVLCVKTTGLASSDAQSTSLFILGSFAPFILIFYGCLRSSALYTHSKIHSLFFICRREEGAEYKLLDHMHKGYVRERQETRVYMYIRECICTFVNALGLRGHTTSYSSLFLSFFLGKCNL